MPDVYHGVPQQPLDGVSMLYAFDDAAAPNRKQRQYYEMFGNRAIWSDGWKAVTLHAKRLPWEFNVVLPFEQDEWELYHVAEDFSESTNVAAEHPEKLEELKAMFDEEAWKYNVYPTPLPHPAPYGLQSGSGPPDRLRVGAGAVEGVVMPWKRSENNPILTRESIPDIHPHVVDPSAVLNPGAIRHGATTLLLLHVQTRGRETHLLRAVSRDGETFKVDSRPARFFGLEKLSETVHRIYDPRITRLEDRFCVMVALDLDSGCRLGLAVTENFETLEFVGLPAEQDLRDGVLFPERIGGKCLRLERPNRIRLPGGQTSGDQIWLSASDDLENWEPVGRVLRGRPRHWDELIGAGPPPVKTREGWLHIYHGVALQPLSGGVYQAGALLLDLEDPTKVLARSRNNCLEPREPYEVTGRTPNVIFPTGLIVDEFDKEGFAVPTSTVRLYYGAAGTSVALASTTMRDLLAMCLD